MAFKFSNLAEAVLTLSAGVGDTTLQVDSALASRFATPSGADVQRCSLTDDSTAYELVDITSNPLTGVLTVTRGVEGTSPREWLGGTCIRQEMTAAVLTSIALTTALGALSSLTPAANLGIVFTGPTTAGLFSLTPFSQTLLDDTSQGAMQATLGLVPGTNVQAFNALLATYVSAGGLTSAEIAQVKNIDTTLITTAQWGYLGLTSAFMGSLVGTASAPLLLSALGVGTGSSPQFLSIELGHATDTTITRIAAGRIAVEGVELVNLSLAQTLENKTLNAPAIVGGTLLDITSLQARPTTVAGVSGTLVVGNANKVLRLNGAVTIPSGVFTDDDWLVLIGDGTARLITQGGGGTQTKAGGVSTGNFTLAANGVAAVCFSSTTAWLIAGDVT